MKFSNQSHTRSGIFILVGIVIFGLSLIFVDSQSSLFTQTQDYKILADKAEGITPGAKVLISGIRAGSVSKLHLSPATREIEIHIQIDSDFRQFITKDTQASLQTQGLLGDRYVALTHGEKASEMLESGSEIPLLNGPDLSGFLSDGEVLLMTLTEISQQLNRILGEFEGEGRSQTIFASLADTSENLKELSSKLKDTAKEMKLTEAVNSIESIARKIDQGQGTLGALVNDSALYEQANELVGGVNKNHLVKSMVRSALNSNSKNPTEENSDD